MRKLVALNLLLTWMTFTITLAPCSAGEGRSLPLKISENGRYFVDGQGKPFFWQGDTEWELFHLFSVPEAQALLQKRHTQGFNVIQVMMTGVFPEWGNSMGMKPWKDLQAWQRDDPFTPNEEYFKRADAIITAAEEFGMVLVIGIYHARDVDNGRITASNAEPWAKWLARRYQKKKNVVWSMYPHAHPSSESVIWATMRGVLEGDSGAHLITMHPDPSPTSSSFMHAESWLSFNTLQTWSSDFLNYDMVKADYARTPSKPVVDGEARYEDEDGTTPLQVRRGAYWSCLAGGFYSYGHRDNWKSPQTWKNWCDAPGALQVGVLGSIFRSIHWWRLVPDPSILVDPIQGNVTARSADGDWILAYLTVGSPVSIRLQRFTASTAATGWWINPLDGARTKIGIFSTSTIRSFPLPAGWQDAVLLLEK